MGEAVQRRWPKNAEAARKRTIEAARDGRRLCADAREKVRKREHPARVELDIADLETLLADIERLMTEAKIGIE